MKKKCQMNFLDRGKNLYTKVMLTEDKESWEVFTSETKQNWVRTHTGLTLDQVMKIRGEIIDSNFKNLFGIITSNKT